MLLINNKMMRRRRCSLEFLNSFGIENQPIHIEYHVTFGSKLMLAWIGLWRLFCSMLVAMWNVPTGSRKSRHTKHAKKH